MTSRKQHCTKTITIVTTMLNNVSKSNLIV